MEAIIRTENKMLFDSLLLFVKSLNITVERKDEKKISKQKGYDFFQSAGMWRNRDISGKLLREKAWSR